MTVIESTPQTIIAKNFPTPAVVAPELVETRPPVEEAMSRVVSNGFYKNITEVALGGEALIDPKLTMETIRAMLANPDDKGRRIPNIEVTKGKLDDYDPAVSMPRLIKNESGEPIGNVTKMYIPETKTGFLGSVIVEPDQGYGTSVYLNTALEFLEQGVDFRNDPSNSSEDAKNMWEKLRDAGLAVAVQEFEEYEPGHYAGYYVINGNNLPKSPDN